MQIKYFNHFSLYIYCENKDDNPDIVKMEKLVKKSYKQTKNGGVIPLSDMSKRFDVQ